MMIKKLFNKYLIISLLFLILFSLFSYSFVLALTKDTSQSSEGGTPTAQKTITYPDPTSADGTFTGATPATETTEAVPATYIPDTTAQYQINNIPPEVKINSVDGSIFNMEITNALFSLGSLIQGSFISISNNNNVYLKSFFDTSKFTATMNEDGQLEVAQINGHGEMGKVYIEINNGNLTQDDKLTFIPTGENPTYIYYNTTEIEFKDGNLS